MQYNATVFCIGVNRFFTGNALERERERERETDRQTEKGIMYRTCQYGVIGNNARPIFVIPVFRALLPRGP